ncbi:hypothetical protein D3C86_2114130 [compost metagenome]
MAGAEPTEPIAIGDVKIERQIVAGIQFGQPLRIDVAIYTSVKMRRSRIASVSRHRA